MKVKAQQIERIILTVTREEYRDRQFDEIISPIIEGFHLSKADKKEAEIILIYDRILNEALIA